MAIAISEYCKAFFKSHDIEEVIPYSAFLNEQTCVSKTDTVIAVFAIAPLDDECMSEAERAHAVSNLMAAHNLLDPNCRHCQYLFRTRRYIVPERSSDLQTVRELEQRRRQHLLSNAKGATIEIYQAIELLAEGKLLTHASKQERRQHTRRQVETLDLISRAYEISAGDLQPRRMQKQEAFGLFYRLLHTGRAWEDAPALRSDTGIARQLRDASVYWDPVHDCLRVGRRAVRVFTLKELPDNSAPNLFGESLKIDAEMTIISTWRPQERIATHEQLIRLRTLMINFERQGFNFGIRAAMRNDPTLREDLQNSGCRDDIAEINELLGQIRRKRHTGVYSMTILLHADKPEDLEKPAAEISKVFRLPMAALHEETGQYAFGVAIPTFFGIMPGNAPMNALRVHPLRNDHYAELSTIWSCDVGETSEEYANVYETRLGPLHRLSKRYAMVANRAVLGMTRQGKTVCEIDYLGALQVQNPITRVYDVGGGYESLAHYFHGSILRCSLGEWNIRVNPFEGPVEDPNFQEFAFEFARFLAESDGRELTYDDILQLSKKIKGLLQLPKKLRRLKTLVSVIEGDMKYALMKWVEGEIYGDLFDHAEDDLTLNDFQVFEFAKVEDGSRHAYLEALQLLLIYRDTQIVMDTSQRGRLKHITFDECVAHWRHPRMADYIKRILKTFQKFNGSLSLVTQSPEDFGLLEPFVLQNCSSFVFFANPKIDDDVLRKFGMDDARIEVFRGLQPREFLFHGLRANGDLWKVLRLTVDPYRYWMYTTSPNDVVKRNEVFAKDGTIEGLKLLAAEGAA